MSPTKPPTTDATGAARRLQALGRAGYGAAHIAELMAASRMHVKAWQHHRWHHIYLSNHQRIDYTYWKLWDTEGPSTLARKHAERKGWQTFDAWTEHTIDDPGAPPYSDPEQINYIDRVLLHRVYVGRRPYLDLTAAEKVELLAAHLQAGYSLRGFRNRYRPVPKRELAWLIKRRPDVWPLFNPEDLSDLLHREVRLEDLWLAG